MNPKAYCLEHGIKTLDFIEKAREVAPKYSKSTHCMASDPAYGVTLRGSVAAHVRGRKPEKRKLPCRICFRCSPAFMEKIRRAKAALAYETDQDFCLFAIRYFLDRMESET